VSSSDPPAGGAALPRIPLAHHFESLAKQTHAVRLGMWLFLSTEVLLFAGLFVAYATYRYLYHPAFHLGARHLSLVLGGTNTVVLISSSLTVALALEAIRVDQPRRACRLLLATLGCAATFLVIKGFEYHHHIETGALPGRLFHMEEMAGHAGAPVYFTLYFFATGLHAFHVMVGMGVLTWVLVRTRGGAFSAVYHTPVEMGALYWHLVDLIWIFLFPLLYLV
jgi:cytochrome c oxidase subunit 3